LLDEAGPLKFMYQPGCILNPHEEVDVVVAHLAACRRASQLDDPNCGRD